MDRFPHLKFSMQSYYSSRVPKLSIWKGDCDYYVEFGVLGSLGGAIFGVMGGRIFA